MISVMEIQSENTAAFTTISGESHKCHNGTQFHNDKSHCEDDNRRHTQRCSRQESQILSPFSFHLLVIILLTILTLRQCQATHANDLHMESLSLDGGDEEDYLMTCSRPSKTPRSMLYKQKNMVQELQLPCDMNLDPNSGQLQSWCNLPGPRYPWHAVRRFVFENQGLMRRMYGEVRQLSLLRMELSGDVVETNHLGSGATQPAASTVSPSPTTPSGTGSLSHHAIVHQVPTPTMTSTTAGTSTNKSTTSIVDGNGVNSSGGDSLEDVFQPIWTPPTNVGNTGPQKQDTIRSSGSEDDKQSSSEKKASNSARSDGPKTETLETKTSFQKNKGPSATTPSQSEDVDMTTSATWLDRSGSTSEEVTTTMTSISDQIKESDTSHKPTLHDAPSGSSASVEDDFLDLSGGHLHDHMLFQDFDKPRESSSPSSSPPVPEAKQNLPSTSQQNRQNPNKFQQEPVGNTVMLTKGVNACPVKEEVVAPYWANNTRGEILALLNLYPFEQYVHWEKCTNENRQMHCRHGCRCEQQYRLHRLLAFDPTNECRGIFSDWFRFPSCCVCKCYNMDSLHDDLFLRSGNRRSPRNGLEIDDDVEVSDNAKVYHSDDTKQRTTIEHQLIPTIDGPDVSGVDDSHFFYRKPLSNFLHYAKTAGSGGSSIGAELERQPRK